MDEMIEIKDFLRRWNWDIPEDELTPENIEEIKGTLAFAGYRLNDVLEKCKDDIRKRQPFTTILKWLRP